MISFLAAIPYSLYHAFGSMFFADEQVKNITVTMSWGQVCEIFFLFAVTGIMLKLGFKKTLLIGLGAMLLRYLSFYLGVELGQQWWYIIGILMHGIIFTLFFICGQIFINKVTPVEMRAQAQGFLSFVFWGMGYLTGVLLNGWIIGHYRIAEKCNWSVLFLISMLFTLVATILLILLLKPEKNPVNQ